MHLDILAAVVITATIQSLFGVGVLLFGTPILLILGYPFTTILAVLLPVSLSVNLLQVSKHYACIDRQFYKKILLLAVPCIVLFLFLVTQTAINIGVIVGLFLILVALEGLSARVNRFIQSMIRYERTYILVMGAVHGLTNLGGALLTAIVHSKRYAKDVTRATIAAAYGTFVVFQLLTLFVSLERFPIAAAEAAIYVLAGAMTFFVTERVAYTKIGADKYRATFAAFLFGAGVVLIVKAVFAR